MTRCPEHGTSRPCTSCSADHKAGLHDAWLLGKPDCTLCRRQTRRAARHAAARPHFDWTEPRHTREDTP